MTITKAETPLEALEAIGVIGGGYCFCYGNYRDPDKPKDEHTGECREARAVIKEAHQPIKPCFERELRLDGKCTDHIWAMEDVPGGFAQETTVRQEFVCKLGDPSPLLVQDGSRRVFHVSGSGVHEDSTDRRPTPKWQRPLLRLRQSYQHSALRLLLAECGSFFPRILEVLRIRKHPPQALSDSCLSNHRLLFACSRDMTRLQKDFPWQGYLGAQLAFQAWLLGAEESSRILNNSGSDTAQTASSVTLVSRSGNDYKQPLETQQESASHEFGFTEQVEKKKKEKK